MHIAFLAASNYLCTDIEVRSDEVERQAGGSRLGGWSW
jgi:hypothetical protein